MYTMCSMANGQNEEEPGYENIPPESWTLYQYQGIPPTIAQIEFEEDQFQVGLPVRLGKSNENVMQGRKVRIVSGRGGTNDIYTIAAKNAPNIDPSELPHISLTQTNWLK